MQTYDLYSNNGYLPVASHCAAAGVEWDELLRLIREFCRYYPNDYLQVSKSGEHAEDF